ncbi:MAG: extracellular solute-binding protein [Pseudoxanthomonas sp.]
MLRFDLKAAVSRPRAGAVPMLLALLIGMLGCGVSGQAQAAHAYAEFGTPRYPPGFTQFDYVNPQAPKQGRLRLAQVTTNATYDKLNPFTLRGRAAPGLLELVFETLAVYSMDERATQYGLLAESIEVAPDLRSVIYRLRPQARFSNGDPVTAEDVVNAYHVLRSPQASPRFQSFLAEVTSAKVLGTGVVRFDFSRAGRDLVFVTGSLPVFSHKWSGPPAGAEFGKVGMRPPIASGPYSVRAGGSTHQVTYVRDPRYWGADLPVRKGQFNFSRITYNLYSDLDTRRAALRAGHYDFLNEVQMWPWRVMYFGERFDRGELIKMQLPHQNPPAMNGWTVNLRRARFRDRRVRQALNYLFDFEWINDRSFDGKFVRLESYFDRTPLAATGRPSKEELALLVPYRDALPPAVFGPMFQQPSTHAPSAFRANLAKAIDLFGQAGWTMRDGRLRNARGEPFVIEVMLESRKQGVTDLIYQHMERAGITVRKVIVDQATLQRRLSNFDFDYTRTSLRESRNPSAEIWRWFNSADAARTGSENITGVNSRVVDDLTHRLMAAATEQEQVVAGRALDRVLIHEHYFIPWRYLPQHHVIYNRRLEKPDQLPLYYAAQEWAMTAWWDRVDD